MSTAPRIDSQDIPQADSLRNLRHIVDAIGLGASTAEQIEDRTQIASRHVAYALHAARTLGWVVEERGGWGLTALGAELRRTSAGGEEERACFRKSFKQSVPLQVLVPDLLEKHPPSREALTKHIEALSGLSLATADRRAQALLSWRNQMLSVQRSLFEDL
jgi:hypothetical protein